MPQSVPAPTPTSPVTAAYARLTEVLPMVSVTELSPMDPLPEGEGWVSAAGLAAAGAELDAFLARDATQTLRDHGREGRPDVAAAFGLRRDRASCRMFCTPTPGRHLRRLPAHPARRTGSPTDGRLNQLTDLRETAMLLTERPPCDRPRHVP